MAFSVVNAGQRNLNLSPELVATSTLGGFRLTGPATKVLGVKPTDYIMFLHDEEENTWAIAKGYLCKKANGEPQTCSDRIDRKAIVTKNFDSALDAAMNSGKEKLVSALTVEGITKEKQIEILASAMKAPEVYKYQGSKTASPSGMTGEGANVNFTDTNVWKQLKADMDDDTAFNRTFALNVNEVIEIPVFDGRDTVVVKALVLGEYTDDAPVRKGE